MSKIKHFQLEHAAEWLGFSYISLNRLANRACFWCHTVKTSGYGAVLTQLPKFYFIFSSSYRYMKNMKQMSMLSY